MAEIITVDFFAGATLLLLACGLYSWQGNPRASTNRAMLVLCLLLAVGNLGQVMAFAAHSKAIAIGWYHVSWVGWAFYPAVAVLLGMSISDHLRFLKPRWLAALLLLPGGIIFIRSLSGLLGISDFTRTNAGTFVPIQAYGGWHLVYPIYQSLFVLLALGIIAYWGITARNRRIARQAVIVIFFSLLALALDVVRWQFDRHSALSILWPIEYLIFSGGLLYAVTKHKFIIPNTTLAAGFIIDHVRELVLLLSEEGEVLQANRAGCDLLGWSESELVGRRFSELYVSEAPQQAAWPLPGGTQAVATRHEGYLMTRSGALLPVLLSSALLQDSYGDRLGIVLIGEDLRQTKQLQREIAERMAVEEALRAAHNNLERLVEERTVELSRANADLVAEIVERMRITEALQEREAKFRSLFEHMKEGVSLAEYVYNDEGRIVNWIIREINPALEEMMNLAPGAGVGLTGGELFGDARRMRCLPILEHLAATHQPFTIETYLPEFDRFFILSFIAVTPELFALVEMDITDRRRAEDRLRASEEKYRALTETSTDIIMRFDRECRFLFINQAVTNGSGRRPEEYLGKTHAEVGFTPELAATCDRDIQQVFRTGQPVSTQIAFALKRGRIVYDWRLFPEFAADGSVNTVVSSARDITRLKETEEALRTSEERFRSIVETFPGIIWMTHRDPNRPPIYFSATPDKSYGYPLEDVSTGRLRFTDVLFPEDLARLQLAVDAALVERRAFSLEVRLRRADGKTAWLLIIGAGVFADDGTLSYLLGTALDITERKETELALLESEWQYEALFANMNEGFGVCEVIYDDYGTPIDWVVEEVNPAFARIIGQSQEALVGRRISRMLPSPGAYLPYMPLLARVAETGQPALFEAAFPNLQKQFIISAFSPRSGRFAVIFYDVTERKQAEERIRLYQRELRGLAVQLSQAEEHERHRIATSLHDTVIQHLALTKILLGSLRVQVADPGPQGLLAQIRVLLDEAIQQARTLTFELSPPILHELGLAAAIEWLAEQIQQRHHLAISVAIDPDWQRGDDEDHRVLLFTAVREVLVNVVKHARATHIAVELERLETEVCITITDDGAGFDVGALKQTRERHGFGLFSIEERLRHLGGRLDILSRPGEGTRVTLTTPMTAGTELLLSRNT